MDTKHKHFVVPRWMKTAGLLMGVMALMAACSDDKKKTDDTDDDSPQALALATWWLSGSEQEALTAMVNLFKTETGIDVNIVGITSVDIDRLYEFREKEWDIGQANSSQIASTQCILDPSTGGDTGVPVGCLKDTSGNNVGYIVEDLSTIAELDATLAQLPADLLELMTVDGKVLSFPTNVNRTNTLHYAGAVTDPPETLTELRAFCDNYRACVPDPANPASEGDCTSYPYGAAGDRPKPLGLTGQASTSRLFVQGAMPPDVVAHTIADPTPYFVAALDTLLDLVTRECVWMAPIDAAGDEKKWFLPAHAIIDGDALMYVLGAGQKARWSSRAPPRVSTSASPRLPDRKGRSSLASTSST